MKKILFALLFIVIFKLSFGQTTQILPVYKVNKKIEIPASLVLYALNPYGFSQIEKKTTLTPPEIAQLDANDICPFDRWATQQNVSSSQRAADISDFGLNTSIVLPFTLMLDRHIRKEWANFLVLYAEAHVINSTIYLVAASTTNRIRPFVYSPDIALEPKTKNGTKNSFYSGHTSSTATSTFFMAKVYSDYHPELGNKKYWLFGAAAIPPAIVGYNRVKAMKHFPTDVITGFLVGTSVGILVPHLHKVRFGDGNLSFMPFSGRATGVSVCYTFE